jgi:hypothetical protein
MTPFFLAAGWVAASVVGLLFVGIGSSRRQHG